MINIPTPRPSKPGVEKFIKRYESIYGEKPSPEIISREEAKERIKFTLERLKEEIEKSPAFEEEIQVHGAPSSTSDLSDVSNTLAQAVQIALEEGVDKALNFILATGNPFLVDMFHDVIIEHFLEALVNLGKIKLIT